MIQKLLILITVAATTATIGTIVLRATPKPEQPQTISLPSQAFPKISDPVLQKHFQAQTVVTAYRVQSTSSDRIQATVTEVQSENNRFLLKTDKFIIVDNTAYFQEGESWRLAVLPLDEATSFNRFRPETIRQNYQNYQQNSYFKAQGTDKCATLTCYRYEQIDTASPSATTALRVFWFDTKDYLLRHDIFKFGRFTSENFYTYDNIDIVPPL